MTCTLRPNYKALVTEALCALASRSGSSTDEIEAHLVSNNPSLKCNRSTLRQCLKRNTANGYLSQAASGSFKLAANAGQGDVGAAAAKAKAPATKAKAKAAAPKAKKPATKTILDKIVAAITDLEDPEGSSRQAIKKYLREKWDVRNTAAINKALQKGVSQEKLLGGGKFKVVGGTWYHPSGPMLPPMLWRVTGVDEHEDRAAPPFYFHDKSQAFRCKFDILCGGPDNGIIMIEEVSSDGICGCFHTCLPSIKCGNGPVIFENGKDVRCYLEQDYDGELGNRDCCHDIELTQEQLAEMDEVERKQAREKKQMRLEFLRSKE